MESNKRKQLLQKYWLGQTTLAEETTLREWYRLHADGTEPELEKYFNTLTDFSEIVPDPDFKIKLPENNHVRRINRTATSKFSILQKIAAVLIVAFGFSIAWQMYKEDTSREEVRVSQTEIEQSYEEAKAALLLIASKLNKGKDTVSELNRFSETTERVKSNIITSQYGTKTEKK